ncbi:spermine synthase [Streptomyces sp. RKND-216]|uniref:spermidine synthase n=1 Tax=Streptomyces sp. RKND-216 TaxID=2562581 RepID=UPI00109DA4F2|nr:fused MFS/spermidine synthase [Streptomyces sp. RKND-216]THA26274.1 spermine synthase [Streptomyces sp. RKND-216]
MARRRRDDAGRRRTRQHREEPAEPVGGGLARLEPDPDRPRAWTLTVDDAPQSHVDLDDPAYLDFAYQRRLGHVLDLAAPPSRPLRVLHLGGGALTLARYVAVTRPRSTQQAAETDTALTAFVRRALPLDPGWRIRVRSGDARAVLARVPDGWADVVLSDVFHGARTPAHLTSVEFVADGRRVLRPGGVWAANLADGGGLTHLRGQVATVGEVFREVCAVADPAVLRGRRFGNVVLAASDAGLDVAELTRRVAGDPHPGRVEHGAALASFAAGAKPVTDATAAPSPAPPTGSF